MVISIVNSAHIINTCSTHDVCACVLILYSMVYSKSVSPTYYYTDLTSWSCITYTHVYIPCHVLLLMHHYIFRAYISIFSDYSVIFGELFVLSECAISALHSSLQQVHMV